VCQLILLKKPHDDDDDDDDNTCSITVAQVIIISNFFSRNQQFSLLHDTRTNTVRYAVDIAPLTATEKNEQAEGS